MNPYRRLQCRRPTPPEFAPRLVVSPGWSKWLTAEEFALLLALYTPPVIDIHAQRVFLPGLDLQRPDKKGIDES